MTDNTTQNVELSVIIQRLKNYVFSMSVLSKCKASFPSAVREINTKDTSNLMPMMKKAGGGVA